MNPILLAEVVPFLGLVISFIYGAAAFFKKGIAMYLQLIVCALGSLALGHFFRIICILTSGALPAGFHVGYLGDFSCFMFLFSANYGQMDGIVDDGSEKLRSLRRFSLVAPVVLVILLSTLFLADMRVIKRWILIFSVLPALPAAYYNLKHMLIPDMDFGFIRAIRPFNGAALAFIFINIVYQILYAFGLYGFSVAASALLAACSFIVIRNAKKGVEQWKI